MRIGQRYSGSFVAKYMHDLQCISYPSSISALTIILHVTPGTLDSSGMRIWYIDTPREHEAAIMEVGYEVHPFMVVPPNAKNFTITGLAVDECTSTVCNVCPRVLQEN